MRQVLKVFKNLTTLCSNSLSQISKSPLPQPHPKTKPQKTLSLEVHGQNICGKVSYNLEETCVMVALWRHNQAHSCALFWYSFLTFKVSKVLGILHQVPMFGLPTKHLETLSQMGSKLHLNHYLGEPWFLQVTFCSTQLQLVDIVHFKYEAFNLLTIGSSWLFWCATKICVPPFPLSPKTSEL